MDDRILKGIEVERNIKEKFYKLGWDVVDVNNASIYDFQLFWNGKFCGGVDCFYAPSISVMKRILARKIKSVEYILETEKPPIFVLTNGGIYDIYYNGSFVYSLSFPPDPEGFMNTWENTEI